MQRKCNIIIYVVLINVLLLINSCCANAATAIASSPPNSSNDQQQQQQHRQRLKVLVYSPSFGWSHMQFLGKIADTLVEAGHEVHYVKLLANPELNKRNETKLVHKVHRITPKFVSLEQLDLSAQMAMLREPFRGHHFAPKLLTNRAWTEFMMVVAQCCREIVSNEQLLADLTMEKFDLAISEMYDDCPFAFFHRIGVRTKIGALAIPLTQMAARSFGIPTFSSYVPNFDPPMNPPLYMNFFERAINFYNELYDWGILEEKTAQLFRPIIQSAFGPDFPPLEQHLRNTSLLFVNSNPFLEFPRPLSNKVVYIGGLVDQKTRKLDEKIRNILDGSSGAVLVSFGSIADTRKMSVQMRRALVSAFADFPEFDFIWKLDNSHELVNDETTRALFASATNVHLFDWVEQNAILRHPILRGFVSHCGQNSLTEAAHAGVPLVAVPLFGDQLYNSLLAKHKGMAVYVDVRQLNEHEQIAKEVMKNALEKILHDPAYRSNAQLISQKIAFTPFSPKDRLVHWVEFASMFPELNDLNLPGDNELHWFVYYSLDVILFSLIVIALATFTILKFASFVWKIIFTKNQKDPMLLNNSSEVQKKSL